MRIKKLRELVFFHLGYLVLVLGNSVYVIEEPSKKSYSKEGGERDINHLDIFANYYSTQEYLVSLWTINPKGSVTND
jgi:hypothetical protein